MEILLANPRGFCAGVNMAIECLEETIKLFGSEIYVYHEIVHNKYVVDRFTEQGVTFVEEIEEVPEGSILLYSAHGISPATREKARQRNLRTIDATCPLVTKVHLEALRFAREDYEIVLIGHEDHDEVIGTMGEAPDRISLVETVEEIEKLPFGSDCKIAYLTQTTLSVQEASNLIEKLKERFPQIESPPKDDICYATTNRQKAVEELALEADVIVVLGSQNSSNSQRLKEIGKSHKKQSYLIDGVHELQQEWFQGDEKVLVTAGASAPEIVVQDCVAFLQARFQATISEKSDREENVNFVLPKELRELRSARTA